MPHSPTGLTMADHAQCHRDIDQLLAEIELLRNMLRLCEQHCSDGWIAEQTRTLLAHSVAHIDGADDGS